MDSIEVPHYFTCPISLQIMRDPVTATTGITYDRGSIERWLFTDGNLTCPVTNQPLPLPSPLTPNHTLRRLIQSWCTLNSVDRIPTPRAPLDPPAALSLLRRLSPATLPLISVLAADNHSNRRCMLDSGLLHNLAHLIVSSNNDPDAINSALLLIFSLRLSPDDLKPAVSDNHDLIDSLTLLLTSTKPHETRSNAVTFLRSVLEVASPSLLSRLKVGFFQAVTLLLRDGISAQATKAALQVMLFACSVARNQAAMVEAGAVWELVELELAGVGDKRTTELVLGVLDRLCECADGRARLVEHAAGIAVVGKRILRVSAAADERAVRILWSLSRYSVAGGGVVQEMLRVGAASKLCAVMQADCDGSVREKARWVLRLHSGAWKDSPCIHSYLLTTNS